MTSLNRYEFVSAQWHRRAKTFVYFVTDAMWIKRSPCLRGLHIVAHAEALTLFTNVTQQLNIESISITRTNTHSPKYTYCVSLHWALLCVSHPRSNGRADKWVGGQAGRQYAGGQVNTRHHRTPLTGSFTLNPKATADNHPRHRPTCPPLLRDQLFRTQTVIARTGCTQVAWRQHMAPSLPRSPSLPPSLSRECYLRSGQLDGREGSHQPSGVLALEVAHHQVTARLGLWLLSLLRVLVGQVVLQCGARERGEGRGGWRTSH